MGSSHRVEEFDEKGAALLIVLAFVVLLTGLTLAYFARATTDRQLSKASFDNTGAALLARSALDIVVGDFKQEVANGIAAGQPTAANIRPQSYGTFSDIPNLIRRSFSGDPTNRTSNVNSSTASINGRSVSAARWNKHYLIPRAAAGSTAVDTTPTGSFVAPDWVLVTGSGPAIKATPDSSVVGRYAFAVYDEGGLLDVNVAGFPSENSTDATYLQNIGQKGVLAFADLATIGLSPSSAGTFGSIDNIIGWRNYLSGLPTGGYNTSNGQYQFAFPTNPSDFVTYFLSTTRDFGVVNAPTTYNPVNRSDQAFINRTELLGLRKSLGFSQDALQYLGTLSRDQNVGTFRAPGTSSGFVIPPRFLIDNLKLVVPPVDKTSHPIKQLFGLRWATEGPSGAPTDAYWVYAGPKVANDTDPALNCIPYLNKPANGGKKDFVQYINYALHPDTAETDDCSNITNTLAVVAAIIDQYDAASAVNPVTGSTTTVIKQGPSSVGYGMETIDPNRPVGAPVPPAGYVMLNRPFHNVGEFGYAFNQTKNTTVNFKDAYSGTTNPDPGILDLFTYNSASPRSGTVNLNTRNAPVLAAIIQKAISKWTTSTYVGQTDPSSDTSQTAKAAATAIINDGANGTAANPALSRADVARMAQAGGSSIGASDEEKETISRALAEVGTTRTWGLMVDLVAQTGHYSPNATALADFVVEGEKRYWLHIAIDRFDGTILGQQLEEVLE